MNKQNMEISFTSALESNSLSRRKALTKVMTALGGGMFLASSASKSVADCTVSQDAGWLGGFSDFNSAVDAAQFNYRSRTGTSIRLKQFCCMTGDMTSTINPNVNWFEDGQLQYISTPVLKCRWYYTSP